MVHRNKSEITGVPPNPVWCILVTYYKKYAVRASGPKKELRTEGKILDS
jgi:hypothetical protein